MKERAQAASARSRRRYAPGLVYQAARLYYLEDATQAEIAQRIGTSRATVSRLLAEARETGVVQVRVHDPESGSTTELERELTLALGLRAAYVAPHTPGGDIGASLVPSVAEALTDARLQPGDALLVSSGLTVYSVAEQNLPAMTGVVLCPTVGGVEEPQPQYQTNEITRSLALKVQGVPVMLYAPAMPTPDLFEVLVRDHQVMRVQSLWGTARAALLGVGAPPQGRWSLPSVISAQAAAMQSAIGDICARPYDRNGRPIDFPGVERLIAITLEDLRRVPHTIAVAVGQEKVESILVAARAGYLNTLVTDRATALALVEAVVSRTSPSDSTEAYDPVDTAT
jgi:DNA-binding transcriptional regulator LsrR (DeoR family)